MKVRTDSQASKVLNFSQVKRASPELQDSRYSELLRDAEGQQLAQVSFNLQSYQRECKCGRLDATDSIVNWSLMALTSSSLGVYAAFAGHPGAASVAALFAIGAGRGILRARAQGQQHEGNLKLAKELEKKLDTAGERVSASLLSEGSDPGELHDRRYYTGGVIKNAVTVHSRDSGEILRTRVEVVGSQAYQLESDEVEGKVSIRSAAGEQTFRGRMYIEGNKLKIGRFGPFSPHSGSLVQSIQSDGKSTLSLNPEPGRYPFESIGTDSLGSSDKFLAKAYCWDKGQVATFEGRRLVVASPVIPLQDLSPGKVRVLPEGVVGAESSQPGVNAAVECSIPDSYGPGTWCSTSSYSIKPRWVEFKFGQDLFSIRGDAKTESFRIEAADGSKLEGAGKVEFSQGAYRIQQSQPAGKVEQSLMRGEVLLHLQDKQRTIRLNHRSGQVPRATSRDHGSFEEGARELTVAMQENGTYQISDGQNQLELKAPIPLFFLEKGATTG